MKRKLQIIGNIFGAPSEAFTALKEQSNWFTVFIIIAVVSIGIAWAILPFSEQMARTKMLESGMDATQMEQGQAMAQLFSSIGLFLTPLPLLIKWLVFAGLFYLGVRLLGSSKALAFKTMFAAVVYSELILVFSMLINAALLLCFKDIGDVQKPIDLPNDSGAPSSVWESRTRSSETDASQSGYSIRYMVSYRPFTGCRNCCRSEKKKSGMVSRVGLAGRHRLSDSSLCIFVMAKSTTLCRVAVEGCPSTALSEPCVRLSPHTETLQLSVAINAVGSITTSTFFLWS